MKRINILCFLMLGLITSISAYAGVTDGGVTVFRWSGNIKAVVFTDDPLDDPGSAIGPFGASVMSPGSGDCTAGQSFSGIRGLVCSGTSGDPITDYTCDLTPAPNASNTTWCLYSENPRTGDKAWAVRYVNGDIPTNDGDSIVRCKGTDIFDSENGCQAWASPSQISIEGGYIKLDTMDGNAPFNVDCAETAHNGRMVVDDVNDLLYICTASGWKSTTLN